MNLTEFLKDGGFSPEVGELARAVVEGGPGARSDAGIPRRRFFPGIRAAARVPGITCLPCRRACRGGEKTSGAAHLCESARPLAARRRTGSRRGAAAAAGRASRGRGGRTLLAAAGAGGTAPHPEVAGGARAAGVLLARRGGLDRRDRHDLQGRARRLCRDESAADPLAPFFDRAPAFPGRPLRISGAYRAGLGSGHLPQPGPTAACLRSAATTGGSTAADSGWRKEGNEPFWNGTAPC